MSLVIDLPSWFKHDFSIYILLNIDNLKIYIKHFVAEPS
jgi:hypothetical protein